MTNAFTVKFLDAWPEAVMESVQRDARGTTVESARSLNRRLLPLTEVTSVVSALCALVTICRTIWTQRKATAPPGVPDSSMNAGRLNEQLRLSGNFGAEIIALKVMATGPLSVEIAIRNPQVTDIRKFALELAGDEASVKQIGTAE